MCGHHWWRAGSRAAARKSRKTKGSRTISSSYNLLYWWWGATSPAKAKKSQQAAYSFESVSRFVVLSFFFRWQICCGEINAGRREMVILWWGRRRCCLGSEMLLLEKGTLCGYRWRMVEGDEEDSEGCSCVRFGEGMIVGLLGGSKRKKADRSGFIRERLYVVWERKWRQEAVGLSLANGMEELRGERWDMGRRRKVGVQGGWEKAGRE